MAGQARDEYENMYAEPANYQQLMRIYERALAAKNA
jgi:hypothetical protein